MLDYPPQNWTHAMSHWNRQLAVTCLLLCAASVGQQLAAEDTSYNVYVDDSVVGGDADGEFDFAIDSDADAEFWLTQTQPDAATAETPTPTPTRSRTAAARRRRSTYRSPSMFGDFYGGSSLQALIQPPAMVFNQMVVDGLGGVDLFVTNRNGGNGADLNSAVPIDVHNGGATGPIIASSINPGTPLNAATSYPISDPAQAGFLPPIVPGRGTIVYNGGTANYVGPTPPGSIDTGDGWALDFSHTFIPEPVLVNIPAGGGAVRRVKIGENNSPIPRDRFIFNYNYFNNVIGGIGDVNRYTFGFEHTFLSESSSVEVLFPFASTLDVNQVAGGPRATDTEFGDLSVILKTILLEGEDYLISAGCGLTVPTGDDARIFALNGPQIIDLQHDSFHVLPYVAMVGANQSGLYWQGFLQLDVDASGNPVDADLTGANLQPVGVLQDQTLLFFDFGAGYWLTDPEEGLPAIAATAEIHYATTLQDADIVTVGGLDITSVTNRYDVLNLTMGASILANESFTIRPAMVIPLAGDDDDQFDYEAMVQMNFWR